MGIQAISQEHNGITYRSRTEARWAEYFSRREIVFSYEPEGFELNGEWYVPDFHLLHSGIFFEVKGRDPNQREQRVATTLASHSGQFVIIAHGNPSCEIQLTGFDPQDRTSRVYLCPDHYIGSWITTAIETPDAWEINLHRQANGRNLCADYLLDECGRLQFNQAPMRMSERRVVLERQPRSFL